MRLSRGSTGEAVRLIQEMLNGVGARIEEESNGAIDYVPLKEDGAYGARTESQVLEFQMRHGLLADGIVGAVTFARLQEDYTTNLMALHSPSFDALVGGADRLSFTRLPADAYKQGYAHVWLRSDVGERYMIVHRAAHECGAKLTSSGGKRDLYTPVSAGRSATSFHYSGRALDLYLYSGMVNPATDPYVVVREKPLDYRVFARCHESRAEVRTLGNVMTYRERSGTLTAQGSFIDLTALFEKQGFRPIPARPGFERGGSQIGAEWWHFQDVTGLVPGVSTFGSELSKVYSEQTLRAAPPWKYRNYVFCVNWN